ncbi:RebB family R body protein [Sneathiella sp.]|uniref:RebB family R body protein n=1 Tax=Sneathiella sp. TaxID=1964365 RepID=UPI00261EBA53|nr:RebB family R body protein [Sneathiella sp.]MDF2368993.1 RebB family R body protein [Sneathiella sp.]
MTAQRTTEHVKSVNSQITDAITQSNTMNIGLAPAQSMGILYQTTAQAVGTSIQNAVSNQQHMYSLSLASTAQNLNSLLSLSSASAARNTAGLLSHSGQSPSMSHLYARAAAPVHAAPTQASHSPPQTPMKK